ncbi:S-adenosyl-L-methionine-dependent methyltransferase [Artemisia annua]|uniref:Methyltransferase n=1 Tax=Artemisia annua TaxID=35608 RepID=A0A2U1Q0B2_ARTAN|nr:S-adenosyl-L-methionine-dependent methyltransferase [Artemisia annua]
MKISTKNDRQDVSYDDDEEFNIKSTETGVYQKIAPENFIDDYTHWKNIVTNSYLNDLGIDWSSIKKCYGHEIHLWRADQWWSPKGFVIAWLASQKWTDLKTEGKLIVHDNVDTIAEIENMVKSMQWNVRLSYNKEKEGFLCVEKTLWRPTEVETLAYTY